VHELVGVLRGLLGERCANLELSAMRDPDRLSDLAGFSINVCDDTGGAALPLTPTLAALLSGAPFRLGRGRTASLVRPPGLHVVMTTALPSVSVRLDSSITRRITVVRTGPGPAAAARAVSILATETEALLARAVRATRRLIGSRMLTEPDRSAADVETWARGVDDIELFLASGAVRRDPRGRASSREVHERYVAWASRAGRPLLALPALVRALERAGVRRTSTGKKRLLSGIRVVS
jgi:hypothetical protein